MNGLPSFMWLDADRVVAKAWDDATKGKSSIYPRLAVRDLEFHYSVWSPATSSQTWYEYSGETTAEIG